MWMILWIVGAVVVECGLAVLAGRFLSLSNSRHGGSNARRRRAIRPSRVIYDNPSTGSLSRPATSPGSW